MRLPDRTSSESVNATPTYLFHNLIDNLTRRWYWSVFYTDTYVTDNNLAVQMACGITTAFLQEGRGDQYGFVVRLVNGANDPYTRLFVTTSYANPTADIPRDVPDTFHHDQIVETILWFCTHRYHPPHSPLEQLKRLFSRTKDKLK